MALTAIIEFEVYIYIYRSTQTTSWCHFLGWELCGVMEDPRPPLLAPAAPLAETDLSNVEASHTSKLDIAT